MTRVGSTGSNEPPEDKENLSESPIAYQKESTGGFLDSKKKGGWEIFFLFVTLQWGDLAAYFKERNEQEALLEKLTQDKKIPIQTLHQLNYNEGQTLNTLLQDRDSHLQHLLDKSIDVIRAYLHSQPQEEIRGDLLHITDPETQETRTFEKNTIRKTAMESFYAEPEGLGEGSVSDEKFREQWLKKGNIYLVSAGGEKVLSLCPRVFDLDRGSFRDPRIVQGALEKVKTGSGLYKIEMPIGTQKSEEVKVNVAMKLRTCRVTFIHNQYTYQIIYSLKEGETQDDFVNRLAKEHILEKDMLLARSYFVTESFKENNEYTV